MAAAAGLVRAIVTGATAPEVAAQDTVRVVTVDEAVAMAVTAGE